MKFTVEHDEIRLGARIVACLVSREYAHGRFWTLGAGLPDALRRVASAAVYGMDGTPTALALATRVETLCEEQGVDLDAYLGAAP